MTLSTRHPKLSRIQINHNNTGVGSNRTIFPNQCGAEKTRQQTAPAKQNCTAPPIFINFLKVVNNSIVLHTNLSSY